MTFRKLVLQPHGVEPCSEILNRFTKMMNDKIEGDYILTGDETFNGMIVGSLTIPTGVYCEMNGMVTSDVIVEAGATVDINGTVGGNLISNGAEVDVRGTVSGSIIERSDIKSVRVHSGAIVVGGRKSSSD